MILHRIVQTDSGERHLSYRCARTTGEFLGWVLALSHEDHTEKHVQDYVSKFVVEGGVSGVRWEDLVEIGEEIATVKTFSRHYMQGVERWWRITYRGDGYDPRKVDSPCECPGCKPDEDGNYGEATDLCLYAEVPSRVQMGLLHDWELAASVWDLPVEVYQLLVTRKREHIRGQTAQEQAREEDRKKKAAVAKANSPQEWSRVAAARARALAQMGGGNGDY